MLVIKKIKIHVVNVESVLKISMSQRPGTKYNQLIVNHNLKFSTNLPLRI